MLELVELLDCISVLHCVLIFFLLLMYYFWAIHDRGDILIYFVIYVSCFTAY